MVGTLSSLVPVAIHSNEGQDGMTTILVSLPDRKEDLGRQSFLVYHDSSVFTTCTPPQPNWTALDRIQVILKVISAEDLSAYVCSELLEDLT